MTTSASLTETRENYKRAADRMAKAAQRVDNKRVLQIAEYAAKQAHEENNPYFVRAITVMDRVPVTIDEFLDSKDFLGEQIEVWEGLKDDIRAMNPDVLTGSEPVFEALLGGATGTGKTTLSYTTILYQLYCLTCYAKPQLLFPGLQKATPIIFLLQSVSSTVTKRVIYRPLREMWLSMPYAHRYVPYDKKTESTLLLPEHNIEVAPALANIQSMVGQAVIGGILDEVNFMSVVENSVQVAGPRGQGGHYDQAEDTYRTLSRRRKSRFTTPGPTFGSLCVLSSTRYKNDFMDRRMTEVREHGEPNVFLFRRKQYDVAPKERYSGKTFPLLIGTDRYPTRVLKGDEQPGVDYPDQSRIEHVPVEYYFEFANNPEDALRDIIGIATDAINPFMAQRHKIVAAIEEGKRLEVVPFVDRQDVDLAAHGMPQVISSLLPDDKDKPRWVHVDLSLTKDRCGIALVKLAGYTNVGVPDNPDVVETVPKFVVEAAISLQPSPIRELDIGEVRQWITQLATYHGLHIAEVTYDGFQSKESIQTLRKLGIKSRNISMDKDTEPYLYLRRCYYEDRIAMVESELARVELSELEYHADKDKIDHPPKGSKDVADAVCGAVHACATSRMVRSNVGVHEKDGDTARAKGHNPRRNIRRARGSKR